MSETATDTGHVSATVVLVQGGNVRRLIGSDPTSVRNIDHLLVGTEAFDLVVGLRLRWIASMDFRSVGQRFAAQAVDSGNGGLDVIHLETDVVNAESQRLAVFVGLKFQDRDIEMAVGEINPVCPRPTCFKPKASL